MGEGIFIKAEAIKAKEMRKRLSMDIVFDFEGCPTRHPTCGACQQRYRDHEVPMPLYGWRDGEEGEDGVHYFYGVLCADCLLSSPAELAAKIRTKAEKILRKPNTRRKQRNEAEGMIEFAGELEKVGSLKDLPGGIMAVKIGEAYREIDGHPKGDRKAA
jgi:hypothetical protein